MAGAPILSPSKLASSQCFKSPSGATLAAMMEATGWQPHSVHGFLAGVVRKRLNLKLRSKKVDGNRVYQIAGTDRGKVWASSHPSAGHISLMIWSRL